MLTTKQIKERNSSVMTFDLKEKYRYDQFKTMPKDIQIEYLTKLATTCGACQSDIAGMMGVKPNTLNAYICKNLPEARKLFNSSRKAKSQSWLDFMASDKSKVPDDILPDEEIKAQQKPISEVKLRNINLQCTRGQLNYSGDPAMVFQKAMLAMDMSKSYDINIIFSVNTQT